MLGIFDGSEDPDEIWRAGVAAYLRLVAPVVIVNVAAGTLTCDLRAFQHLDVVIPPGT